MDEAILNAFWNYEDEVIADDGGDMSTHYYEFWNEMFHYLDPQAFKLAMKRAKQADPTGNVADFVKSTQWRNR
tara:strand:+ start:843 stop:1061 length:219 start_codon:yes stop_codon:yes gene_type:complete